MVGFEGYGLKHPIIKKKKCLKHQTAMSIMLVATLTQAISVSLSDFYPTALNNLNISLKHTYIIQTTYKTKKQAFTAGHYSQSPLPCLLTACAQSPHFNTGSLH